MNDFLKTQIAFQHSGEEDPADVIGKAFGVLDDKFQARFQPTKYIGGGSFGWVYEGIDVKFGTKVALKFMKAECEAGFRAEAKLTKECQHPHVVVVSDYGKDHGMAWMAMEYLEGVSLKRRMRGNQGICHPSSTGFLPTVSQRIGISSPKLQGGKPGEGISLRLIRKFVKEIADALEYAHKEKKVHHHDLKPENILLVNEGKAGECFKLLDFGIATKLDATSTMRNVAFQSALTMAYAAPERFDANLGVDGMEVRSETYSFGVILYEMITGRLPFEWGSSLAEQARAMRDTMFTPPPRFPARVGLADKRKARELEKLVLRCLAKNPADRPASLAEVAAEFEALTSVSHPARKGLIAIAAVIIVVMGIALISRKPDGGGGRPLKSIPTPRTDVYTGAIHAPILTLTRGELIDQDPALDGQVRLKVVRDLPAGIVLDADGDSQQRLPVYKYEPGEDLTLTASVAEAAIANDQRDAKYVLEFEAWTVDAPEKVWHIRKSLTVKHPTIDEFSLNDSATEISITAGDKATVKFSLETSGWKTDDVEISLDEQSRQLISNNMLKIDPLLPVSFVRGEKLTISVPGKRAAAAEQHLTFIASPTKKSEGQAYPGSSAQVQLTVKINPLRKADLPPGFEKSADSELIAGLDPNDPKTALYYESQVVLRVKVEDKVVEIPFVFVNNLGGFYIMEQPVSCALYRQLVPKNTYQEIVTEDKDGHPCEGHESRPMMFLTVEQAIEFVERLDQRINSAGDARVSVNLPDEDELDAARNRKQLQVKQIDTGDKNDQEYSEFSRDLDNGGQLTLEAIRAKRITGAPNLFVYPIQDPTGDSVEIDAKPDAPRNVRLAEIPPFNCGFRVVISRRKGAN